MNTLLTFSQWGFYGLLATSLFGALVVVSAKNIFHCALGLVLTLLGVAGIFFFLRAEFLAVTQILLYVGAIMTLVLFAIMLTHRIGDKTVSQNNRQSLAACLGACALALLLIKAISRITWPAVLDGNGPKIDALRLGQALMKEFVFPFEVVSILLLAALVGAIVIGRED